jgi:hypothetical protein
MKSWKTGLAGLALIGASIYVFVTTHDWTQASIAFAAGVAALCAKDSNVTGGTVQQ